MELAQVRHVSSSELRDFRRNLAKGARRAVAQRHDSRYDQGHMVDDFQDGTAYITRPERPGHKRDPRDVQDALFERRWNALKNASPETVQSYAKYLRDLYPSQTAHLSDEEIIKTIWKQMNKDATREAYRMANRDAAVIWQP